MQRTEQRRRPPALELGRQNAAASNFIYSDESAHPGVQKYQQMQQRAVGENDGCSCIHAAARSFDYATAQHSHKRPGMHRTPPSPLTLSWHHDALPQHTRNHHIAQHRVWRRPDSPRPSFTARSHPYFAELSAICESPPATPTSPRPHNRHTSAARARFVHIAANGDSNSSSAVLTPLTPLTPVAQFLFPPDVRFVNKEPVALVKHSPVPPTATFATPDAVSVPVRRPSIYG